MPQTSTDLEKQPFTLLWPLFLGSLLLGSAQTTTWRVTSVTG
jgi:hypothetical protein